MIAALSLAMGLPLRPVSFRSPPTYIRHSLGRTELLEVNTNQKGYSSVFRLAIGDTLAATVNCDNNTL